MTLETLGERAVGDTVPNDLDAFWMPFTANRAFKQRPRLVSRAKNMHYYTPEGRTVGLAAGIDLAPHAGSPGLRGYQTLETAFHDTGVMIRSSGDTIALSPALIATEADIGEIIEKVGDAISRTA